MNLLFSSSDGHQCLELSEEAMAAIQTEAARKHPLETGGILIGYYSPNNRLATVVVATVPPPDSRHERRNFVRGEKGLQQLLEECKKQNPSLHYIGEWHTHPAYTANASTTDVMQMNWFASRRHYGVKNPVLLVVGGMPPNQLKWRASIHQTWHRPTYLEVL